MESLLNRYRNLTVLLAVILLQLLLVAYQVRTGADVPLLRIWAVNLVVPPGRILENVRSSAVRWWTEYVFLTGARRENRRLQQELDRLRMENRHLRSELGTAERAQALSLFRAQIPSQTVAARVVAAAAGVNSKVVFVDRGASSGVRTGMAVINAEGLIGKVTAAYPSVSQVMLLTAEGFSAGVIGGQNRVQGILKGLGGTECGVYYIHSDEDIKPGDWFYTSGEDRIFPRGLPVGHVKSAGGEKVFKDIVLIPASLSRGIEEVLIVTSPVHQSLPDEQPAPGNAPLMAPPARDPSTASKAEPAHAPPALETDADRLLGRYRKKAESRGAPYGDNDAAAGSAPPVPPPKPLRP